jgi:carbonic anhydrase
MDTAPLTPLLEQLVAPIKASLQSGDDLSKAVQSNARHSATELTRRSDVLKFAEAEGKLTIRSSYCDIGTGVVSLLPK